jgi:hypothetical protein
MGKLLVGKNLFSRAKDFWGWFRKKSPAFIVITSLTAVSVFGLGVGGTLAATGVIPNPFSTETSSDLEGTSGEISTDGQDEEIDLDESPPWEVTFGNADKKWTQSQGEWLPGSSWNSLGAPDTISYRWTTTQLHLRFVGPCPSGAVGLFISPPNYGYLSDPVANMQATGGGGGFSVSAPTPGHPDCREQGGVFVGNMKCYNWNEVWFDVTGPTPVAGLYKIPIPDVIPKVDCPPGSENNDPSKFMFSQMYERLKDYPQAVVTPPKLGGGPATIEWGPYVPSSTVCPGPNCANPTTEQSPMPTTEPSPTPASP